jgi:hypothetical protein
VGPATTGLAREGAKRARGLLGFMALLLVPFGTRPFRPPGGDKSKGRQ